MVENKKYEKSCPACLSNKIEPFFPGFGNLYKCKSCGHPIFQPIEIEIKEKKSKLKKVVNKKKLIKKRKVSKKII